MPATARFARWRHAFVAGVVAITLLTPAAPASADEPAFAVPAAPADVQASAVGHGVRVTWDPVQAQPPVTHYVVNAGPGSCPVTVPASSRAAVLAVPGTRTSVQPQVIAVNAYGQSGPAVSALSVTAKGSGSRYRPVQFLQLSDFHGAISGSRTSAGAAKLTTAFKVDRARTKPTFTVSSGDNIGGAPVISSLFEELPTIEALNVMKFDVTTMGNHEHDRSLAHLRSMIDASRFDWVAANYSTLAPLRTKQREVTPSIVKTRDGVRVGFVGMNTEDTPTVVGPNNLKYGAELRKRIDIAASVAPVQKQINALRADGAQIIVVLAHQGWDENSNGVARGRLVDVASKLRGADVIYGGHSHQRYLSTINGASVVQVPNAGQEYSRTMVCLDTKTGKVVGSWPSIVTASDLADITPDPKAAALVAGYQSRLAAELDVRIGTVDAVFPRGGTPPVERSGETPIGNLAADAVRARYGTQLAFLNGGGFRDTLPASGYTPANTALRRPAPGSTGPYDITLGDALSVMPFGNDAATTTMTGAQLWKALENGVSGYPTEGRFPQISGFRFTFDPARAQGSRITSVTLDDGTPIAADDRSYTATTLDFMVYGGDGYVGVFNPTKATMREPFIDAVVEQFKSDLARGVVTTASRLDGRITRP